MEYVYKTAEMPDDYEGRVVVTLIRALPDKKDRGGAVLYIHGYVDYFFQEHLAEKTMEEGYGFFALELRKYGHSFLPHQHFNYCRSMREYDVDITYAIREILACGYREVILLGHSTGGLLASLYAAKGTLREKISAVVLNSPFLEFNTSALKKYVLIPAVSVFSRLFPYLAKKNELSPFYGESIHVSMRGEWNYDLSLKPIEGVPLYLAWLRAVFRAQRCVKKGLDIRVPVLVLSSDRSLYPRVWNEDIHYADVVLNVKDIEKYAFCLGTRITYRTVPGGMHDLFLSRRPIRERALETVFQWLETL